MSDRHIVRVSAESYKTIVQISKEHESDAGEAADYLVTTAKNRLNALRKDHHRRAQGKPATQRKVTVKTLAPKKAKAPKKAAKK